MFSFAKLPTGITNVLSRLHLRPLTMWKSEKILKTMALKSSVNNLARASFFANNTPVRFFVYFILSARIFTLKRKVYGPFVVEKEDDRKANSDSVNAREFPLSNNTTKNSATRNITRLQLCN